MEPEIKAAAQERMKNGKPSEKFSKGRAADQVAEFTGFSRPSPDKADAIVKAAEAEPEKFSKLVADMDRTGRVDGPFKRLKVMKQAEALSSRVFIPAAKLGAQH